MTGYKRIFVDTTPLIYFLDDDIHFGEKTRQILEEVITNRAVILTSTVTCAEYLVYPYRTGNREKVDAFLDFVNDCDIPLIDIDVNIAKKAAEIRAEYSSFKAMDALQLATAVVHNCDLFLTNDNQLRQFKEIQCITIEEWEIGG